MKKVLIGILIVLAFLVLCIPSLATAPQVTLGIKASEYYYNNPPVDDGSCPYIYTFNGTDYVLENDIFSVARTKTNEYTDYLFLNNPITDTEGNIKLQLKEIPKETSMLDYLGLNVINHPARTKAGVDDKGQAHTYVNPVAPSTAAYNGSDVLSEITGDDKQGVKLYDQGALVLNFPAMDLSQGAKLVLKVDGFERNPDLPGTVTVKVPAVEIQTDDHGSWVTRSKFYPKEYAASGVFDLKPYLDQDNIKVRIVSDSCRADVAHLIDYAALDNTADECTQTLLPLTKALKNETIDAVDLLNTADNSYLELNTEADYVNLEFNNITNPGLNDYFFVSKGYYQPILNTFYVAMKDTAGSWVDVYSNSSAWFNGSADVTQEVDLTAFQTSSYFPNADGTYQVRITNSVGIYDNRWANVDYAYLKVNGQMYKMTSAVDTVTGQNVLAQLQSSDNVKWDVLNKGVILTFAPGIPVTEVRLNKTATTISQGSQETLTATVLPTNATFQGVTWSSSNNAVATVNASGVVTAISVGTATITAKSMDPPSASCTVNVIDNTPPAFSNLTPTVNATVGDSRPVISAKITDQNGIDATRVTLKLNGQTVGAFNSTTGVVSYQPVNVLADGQYTVAVSAYDNYNNANSTSWQFTIRDLTAPQISNVLPPDGTGTRNTRPKISANIVDGGGLNLSSTTLTLDGVPLNIDFQPTSPGSIVEGTVYAVPAAALSTAMHTAVVTVFDLTGNSQQKTWQFGVNNFGEMPADYTNCIGCHNEGPVELENKHIANSGNCSACHGRGIVALSGCEECHSHWGDIPMPLGNYPCTQCHNSSFWDVVPTHGSPTMTPTHEYAQLGQDCLTCHSATLTKTHNIYNEGQPVNNCNTCHKSSDTAVQTAISTGNPACSACHGDAGNHPQKHQNSIETACQSCHANNLVDDHITNRTGLGYSCRTCHNTGVMPTTAIGAAPNLQCNRCHSAAHDVKTASVIPDDIPLYSGVKWSVPFDARIFTGEAWMPQEFLAGGRMLVSERSNGITGKEIRDYYKTALEAKGWMLATVLPGDDANFFDMTFTLNERQVRISFYGGENHTASSVVSSGYKVEILYK